MSSLEAALHGKYFAVFLQKEARCGWHQRS
jgi:hypothetical protein